MAIPYRKQVSQYLTGPSSAPAPKTLRSYQSTIHNRLSRWLGEQEASKLRGESAFIGLATGMGKTFTVCSWLADHQKELGGIVWLTHRDNLVQQSHAELEASMGLKVGIEQAGKTTADRIVVASIPSLQGERLTSFRDNMVAQADGKPILVVFDEAHHREANTWQAVQEAFKPHAQFVNLTATPFIESVENMLELGVCLAYYSTLDAIDLGVLTPFSHQTIHLPELARAEWSPTTGEMTTDSVRSLLCQPEPIKKLVDATLPQMEGNISLVFAASVEHAKKLCAAYSERGLRAAVVCEHTPKAERKAILEDMRAGKIDALLNYDVFTEGTDLPGVNVLVNLRATRFAHKYLQLVGRGLRLLNGPDGQPLMSEGRQVKQACTLIDLLPEDPTTDRKFSYLQLPSELRHSREAALQLHVPGPGELQKVWTRADTFLACFHKSTDIDEFYSTGKTLAQPLSLESLGQVLNRQIPLSNEQKQQPEYWGYHLAQASGFLCIEDLAERLQHLGYEYLPSELPLRGEEGERRTAARTHVTNADVQARDDLGKMDDAIKDLPLSARRILTHGHEMEYKETPRENGNPIQTLQIWPHTALVINPASPTMCYFRTKGAWYKLDTISATFPRKIAPDEMELSGAIQCRPRQSLFARHDIDLERRMIGQLPCTGPQWAAASIMLNSKTAQALAEGFRKAIDGVETWQQ